MDLMVRRGRQLPTSTQLPGSSRRVFESESGRAHTNRRDLRLYLGGTRTEDCPHFLYVYAIGVISRVGVHIKNRRGTVWRHTMGVLSNRPGPTYLICPIMASSIRVRYSAKGRCSISHIMRRSNDRMRNDTQFYPFRAVRQKGF